MGEHLAQGVSQSAQGGIKENELNAGKGKRCPAYISKPKAQRKAPRNAKRAKA